MGNRSPLLFHQWSGFSWVDGSSEYRVTSARAFWKCVIVSCSSSVGCTTSSSSSRSLCSPLALFVGGGFAGASWLLSMDSDTAAAYSSIAALSSSFSSGERSDRAFIFSQGSKKAALSRRSICLVMHLHLSWGSDHALSSSWLMTVAVNLLIYFLYRCLSS